MYLGPCLCVFVCLSVCMAAKLSGCLAAKLSGCLAVCVGAGSSVLGVYLCLSVCLSVCVYLCMSNSLFVCLSVCPCPCPCVCAYSCSCACVCVPVSMPVSVPVYMCVCLCACVFVYVYFPLVTCFLVHPLSSHTDFQNLIPTASIMLSLLQQPKSVKAVQPGKGRYTMLGGMFDADVQSDWKDSCLPGACRRSREGII